MWRCTWSRNGGREENLDGGVRLHGRRHGSSFIHCPEHLDEILEKKTNNQNPTKGVSAMLVLTRKRCESVVVGHPNKLENMLKVTVLEINDESVTLGLETNKDFPVQPWEIWDRIQTAQPIAELEDGASIRRW